MRAIQAKGFGKGQVVVRHCKIPDAKAAKIKRPRATSPDRMHEMLEG